MKNSIFNKIDIHNFSMDDSKIIEIFFKERGKNKNLVLNNKLLKSLNDFPEIFDNNIIEYLKNRYPDSLSFHETILRIKLGIDHHPLCEYCHKRLTKFNGQNSKPFMKYCSSECLNKGMSSIIKTVKNSISEESYGIIHANEMSNQFKRRHIYKEYEDIIIPQFNINQKNEKYDNLIIRALISNIKKTVKHKYNSKHLEILQNYPNIYNYIYNRFVDSDSFKESVYRLIFLYKDDIQCSKEEIETKPKCPICNKSLKFSLFSKKIPYRKYCSNSCAFIATNDEREKTNLEKYGTEKIGSSEIIKQKIKNTNIKRYNVISTLSNPETIEKIKETCTLKYGSPNPMGSEIIKKKIIETIKEQDNIDIEQGDKSFEEYYSEVWSKHMKSEKVQLNSYNTKKKNKSFNKSIGEDRIFNLIKEVYPDIISQHRDKERYPFRCDYYIPNLDLFIEYQGNPNHGGHPFDKNNEDDLKQLEKLNSQNEDLKQRTGKLKTRYDHMIKGWTIVDPKKRELAKNNNLNYIEIWPNWTDEDILNEIKKYNK